MMVQYKFPMKAVTTLIKIVVQMIVVRYVIEQRVLKVSPVATVQIGMIRLTDLRVFVI